MKGSLENEVIGFHLTAEVKEEAVIRPRELRDCIQGLGDAEILSEDLEVNCPLHLPQDHCPLAAALHIIMTI